MPLSCLYVVYGLDTGKLLIQEQPRCKNNNQQNLSLGEETGKSHVKQVRLSKEVVKFQRSSPRDYPVTTLKYGQMRCGAVT